MENKVERCNDRVKTAAKQDLNAMDLAAKNAMNNFTDHVNKENIASANKLGKLLIDMDKIEKRATKNLTEQNKAVDKLKSEVKKAENEGILTINKNANQKIQSINNMVTKAQDLIDKLHGTTSITKERTKDINNLMTMLSNRLEGLSDKFDETITNISDQEQMRVLQWMEKRMQILKANTNDDVIQGMITIKKELEDTLDEVRKERNMITEERKLLEGDRHLFHQWWQSIKTSHQAPDTVLSNQNLHVNTSNNEVDTNNNEDLSDNSNLDSNQDCDRVFTFKRVDQHDEQPARSPINGRVDQEAPQANQQIISIDHLTPKQFPNDIELPLPDLTTITFQKNIFKYHGNINYADNLPLNIDNCWYYDIITFNGVKLTNCSSKYITVSDETVPSNVYGARKETQSPARNSTRCHVRNPYTNSNLQPPPQVQYPYNQPQQMVHNPYRKSTHPTNRYQQQR